MITISLENILPLRHRCSASLVTMQATMLWWSMNLGIWSTVFFAGASNLNLLLCACISSTLLQSQLLFSLWTMHCSCYCTTDHYSQSRTIAPSMYKYPVCNTLVLQFSLLTGLSAVILLSCVHLTHVWLSSPCTLYVSIVLTSSFCRYEPAQSLQAAIWSLIIIFHNCHSQDWKAY